METFKLILSYIWGPFIGAIIGYLTNLIAVKMMFHPYKPWKIGKMTIPFTPGIIPKRKPALAKAIGGAVSQYLFTGDDLRRLFLDEETKEHMVDLAMNALDIPIDFDGDPSGELNTKTANEVLHELFRDEQVDAAREKMISFFTKRILISVNQVNLGKIILEQGAPLLLENKASLGMAALFINEQTIETFLPPLAEKLNNFIAENGEETVRNAVASQIDEYADKPLHNLLKHIGEEQIRKIITATYVKLINGIGDSFAEVFDINGVVAEKVEAMTPRELETLVLAIMKKELSAIINLGAIIGFILGLFTLLSK